MKMNESSAIHFYFAAPVTLTRRKKLKECIVFLFNREKVMFSQLDFIFCTDSELLLINRRFLDHDDLTDIITFTLSDRGEPIAGEIYISVDRIRENAKLFGVTTSTELLRVIFHGCLHLCGYTDKKPPAKKEMTSKENYYLHHFKGN